MAYGYGYGGYPTANGYYAPPAPDQLAQLRQGQYQAPMNPTPSMPAMQQPMQNTANNASIIWVSGEKEAMEYLVAPNSAVALWDSNNPVVYLKKADASGKPDTEIYDLVKRTPSIIPAQSQNVDYVTRADFNALAARADDLAAKAKALESELAELKSKKVKKAKEDE